MKHHKKIWKTFKIGNPIEYIEVSGDNIGYVIEEINKKLSETKISEDVFEEINHFIDSKKLKKIKIGVSWELDWDQPGELSVDLEGMQPLTKTEIKKIESKEENKRKRDLAMLQKLAKKYPNEVPK